jgi:hypothetical protein
MESTKAIYGVGDISSEEIRYREEPQLIEGMDGRMESIRIVSTVRMIQIGSSEDGEDY